MDAIQQSFNVRYEYKVHFTEHLFAKHNGTFKNFLESEGTTSQKKLLFVIDSGFLDHHPSLPENISTYFTGVVELLEPIILPGGEDAKNDESNVQKIVNAVNENAIDRHSYIAAIGGGSVLDVAGYASAIAHRGIRHIRIPTTVLSQNDSGVGVKNGINYFNKKNFLGTFAPPVAVFNDSFFLTTLSDRDWRSGISEAIKVALIKDATFFEWLENNAPLLVNRDLEAMKYLVRTCAVLHLDHIAGGDPFEKGASRPLDFGHWSAHKLEQLTNFEVRHGEAVAIGIALDSAYSYYSGRLTEHELERILNLIRNLGLPTSHPLLHITGNSNPVLAGLSEFREHLGGILTIMLLEKIGRGVEVHELELPLLVKASEKII